MSRIFLLRHSRISGHFVVSYKVLEIDSTLYWFYWFLHCCYLQLHYRITRHMRQGMCFVSRKFLRYFVLSLLRIAGIVECGGHSVFHYSGDGKTVVFKIHQSKNVFAFNILPDLWLWSGFLDFFNPLQ